MIISKIFKEILLILVILAISVGLFFGVRDSLSRNDSEVNILVMGIDSPTGLKARSDSINLVHIDFKNKRMGILAIPRDTLVDIPGWRVDKINHAHAFGGPQLSCQTVSKYLDLPIDYYVEVNFPMFKSIVDHLGGITINVEKPLKYDDNSANLHIDLPAGEQKLNGERAMGFVRFRHDNTSDWGRITRQHEFFQSLAKEIVNPIHIFKMPLLLHAVYSNVRSNLGLYGIMSIGMRAYYVYKYGNIDLGVVPGGDAQIDGGYYMLSNKEGLKKEIDRVIYGIKPKEPVRIE